MPSPGRSHERRTATVDTPGLVRLITALGTPATSDEMVAHTLAGLAEILHCDVACVVEVEPGG
ncbi:MAG TPA: hypothetical protein VGF84_16655, partial [Micromonosporaceae bacterium]